MIKFLEVDDVAVVSNWSKIIVEGINSLIYLPLNGEQTRLMGATMLNPCIRITVKK